MSLHSTTLAWLLGLSFLVPTALSGQTPTSDTTAPAASDSQPALADSVQKADSVQRNDSVQGYSAYQASSDTVLQQFGQDSASGVTSAQPSSDSLRAEADGSAPTPDTAAVSMESGDSILNAACSGPGGPTTIARDLLVVIFAPDADAGERATAVKSVEGKLLGPVSLEEPGAFYLRVPSGGEEYRLRIAADPLVQLPQVRQVGSRACPSLPAPKEPR